MDMPGKSDVLQAEILAAALRLRQERQRVCALTDRRPAMALTNMTLLPLALGKLKSACDDDAKALLEKVNAADARRASIKVRTAQHVERYGAEFAEVETFLEGLEAATNGGPTLEPSSESSEAASE
jgi:hypothetical protein